MRKVSLVAIIAISAVFGWSMGVWLTQQTERSQLARICKKFARIKVFNAETGIEIKNDAISCSVKPNGSGCEDLSRQISASFGEYKILKLLPSSIYIDPIRTETQIGVVRQDYKLSNGYFGSITSFSSKPSGLKNALWSLFLDDQTTISCSDMRIES